ncbi:MAG: hypothetical protein N2Z23_06940 [Pyrinomonadaceae bacterium]|nr:hypothetical protein [Pyrinomonadaceae bacterium]MCX7640159.1 hypothetical protein [Pyrinomonadaceae bacterium]MDW8303253.1 hypothetical protein [Acidobacteriota bacterium]
MMRLFFILFCTIVLSAQTRDHLTERETELIRSNQVLDKRTSIYVQAIERRMIILKGQKLSEKEIENFGEPTGTDSELLNDIAKILLEAIEKIEDVAERSPKNELIMKSTKILAEGCKNFEPNLQSFLQKYPGRKEQGAILSAIEYCQQIKEAVDRKN